MSSSISILAFFEDWLMAKKEQLTPRKLSFLKNFVALDTHLTPNLRE